MQARYTPLSGSSSGPPLLRGRMAHSLGRVLPSRPSAQHGPRASFKPSRSLLPCRKGPGAVAASRDVHRIARSNRFGKCSMIGARGEPHGGASLGTVMNDTSQRNYYAEGAQLSSRVAEWEGRNAACWAEVLLCIALRWAQSVCADIGGCGGAGAARKNTLNHTKALQPKCAACPA